MLLLHKVRLINWHFFHDALIELGEMTLLAGDNGSGKSTIIDAIQYALVADIRKLQFNAAAAQHRTNRTLESYCRCKIGATDLDYYRQAALTHVVLEFRRDGSPFLAGVMVKANAQGEIKETLWLMEQGQLGDIRFSEKELMLKPAHFKEQIKNAGGSICSTKREYLSQLTLLLKVHRRNLEFNPYLEALIRSVSFSPFTSVDRFVCNYILEERQVDISAMKENLLNYKEAEREALAIGEKIEALAKMEKCQQGINQWALQIKLQEYLKRRINLEINRLKQAENKREQAGLEREKNNLLETLNYNEERRQRTEALLDDLKLALAGNDAHLLYKKLSDQKNTLNFNLEKEQSRCDKYKLLKAQCEVLLGRELAASLESEQTELETEKEHNLKHRLEMERRRDETRRLFADLKTEEKDLEKGILRYPESTLSLQQALSVRKIEAWIFADRLEIKDARWQNAVEGWLNTQRFNILVAEKDFQAALEIYNGLSVKIAGVGLPNLARMHQSEIRPGSLAEVVEADSPLARRYVAYLLGGVMMATIGNLKEYEQSITRECMRYSGHTASRVREEVYSRWYIGKNAKEKRLAQIRQEMWELEAELGNLEIKIKTETEKGEMLRRVYDTLFRLKELAAAFDQAERLCTELATLDAELSAIDTTEFEELQNRIGNIQNQLAELRKETSLLDQKVGEAKNALLNLQTGAVQLSSAYEHHDGEL
jgi:chromosome segregation ATPase